MVDLLEDSFHWYCLCELLQRSYRQCQEMSCGVNQCNLDLTKLQEQKDIFSTKNSNNLSVTVLDQYRDVSILLSP